MSRGRRRSAERAAGAAPSRAAIAAATPALTGLAPAWSRPGVRIALVIGVACLVYANSLDGALLFDDTNAIVRNEWVQRGDPVAIFAHPSWWGPGLGRAWRPVTTLTFALDHAVHGLAPLGYHVVNVALHACVSALIVVVLTRVTGAAATATIAALLFAVHPVHTEAVAGVVGRAEILAAAGFFGAWLLFLRADASRRRWLLEGAGVLVFFVALLAKENAVALVPVLVLADLLYPGAPERASALRRHVPRTAALLGACALFALLRATVIGPNPPGVDRLDNPLVALPFEERTLTAIKVVGLYGWRLLVPWRLSADYSFAQLAPVRSLFDAELAWGLVVLVGVIGLVGWGWRRAPAVALGAGFLTLTFALVSNLLFLIGTIMAERLVYLPSAGFCLLLAAALARLGGLEASEPTAPVARRAGGDRAAAPRAGARVPVVAALAALVALYGVRTWARNAVWRDPLTFFSAMVADAPLSARSHRELGNVLAAAGRFEEAQRAFDRSLAIKPADAATLYNLGNALTRAGRYDRAVDAYERAVAAKPDFGDALSNLGNAVSMLGDQEAALGWMRKALALDPGSASLHMNVANTLFRAGRFEEARAEYEAALRLAPDAPAILTNFGAFLLARGDYDAAVAAYERASRTPSPQALVGLTAAYRARGRAADARDAQARAERLFPADAAVRQMGRVLREDARSAEVPSS